MVKYRKADEEDIELLIQLRVDFLTELSCDQKAQVIEKFKADLRKYLTTSLKDGSYVSFIAEEGEKTVRVGGIVIRTRPGSFINPSGKEGYILNMYTIPESRKKGICTEILNLLIREGKKNGITLFELHATKNGEPLYQKNGFQIHIEPTYRKYL